MRLPLSLLALTLPASLLAQALLVKGPAGVETIPIHDPFAKPDAKPTDKRGVWGTRGVTFMKGEVEQTRRLSDIVGVDWGKDVPAPMQQARDFVSFGNPTKALALIEPVLKKFEPIQKVKGSLWLKAAEIKLDALSGLNSPAELTRFIGILEEADDGSIPGLAAKLKLARLTQRVRAEDHAAVILEADKLLAELIDPESQARLHLMKGDSLLALRKYEEALFIYLRVPVFFGAEKTALPTAYLGAAKALRGLDTPNTRDQRLDLVAADYLKQIIRDFPASKEAKEAKSLLPREERVAEEKRAAEESSDKPAEPTPAPAEPKAAE